MELHDKLILVHKNLRCMRRVCYSTCMHGSQTFLHQNKHLNSIFLRSFGIGEEGEWASQVQTAGAFFKSVVFREGESSKVYHHKQQQFNMQALHERSFSLNLSEDTEGIT